MVAAKERGLADTSFFIAAESARPFKRAVVPAQLAVSVITIGELRAGVLTAASGEARARRLSTLESALTLDPIDIDDAIAASWAQLRLNLREMGRRMPVNDSWIAATAITLGIPVVTQDDDFPEGIGRLQVIRI